MKKWCPLTCYLAKIPPPPQLSQLVVGNITKEVRSYWTVKVFVADVTLINSSRELVGVCEWDIALPSTFLRLLQPTA
jgi:hypothetical protein